MHPGVPRRRLYPSRRACNVYQRQKKMSFCLVIRIFIISSFYWWVMHVSFDSRVLYQWVFSFYLFFEKLQLGLLGCGYFNFSFIFLISIFLSWPFYKNFICFQFHLSILNYQILYCPMWYSFFGFLIFILSTFVKVLIVFNFIIQFKLMVLFFKFDSHCFDF
jgi:hypothetical protein